MADLTNLLDEVDEALRDGDDEEQENEQARVQDAQEVATLDAEADWEADDDNDGNRVQQLNVPAALEELERKRYHNDHDQDQDKGEEEDIGFLEHQLDINDDEVQPSESDEAMGYSKLKQIWQQELACPELLPLDETILQQIREAIEQREEAIIELGIEADDERALLASILKIDTDRAKYMLSDLLRTRLHKIQEHPLHMREWIDRMSEAEVEFLKGYGQLLEGHLRHTVLDHVSKDAWKNLDEPEMIDRPDLDQYVFVKVKETSEINSGTEDEPFIQQHQAGTTLITRYSVVRELFAQGKVELVL